MTTNLKVTCSCDKPRIAVLWSDPKQVRLQCLHCWEAISIAKVRYHADYEEVAEDALSDAMNVLNIPDGKEVE